MVHQYFPVLGFTGMSQIQKLIKVFLTSPSTIFSKFNLFYQSQKKKKPNGYETSRSSSFCYLTCTVVNLYCNALCPNENT